MFETQTLRMKLLLPVIFFSKNKAGSKLISCTLQCKCNQNNLMFVVDTFYMFQHRTRRTRRFETLSPSSFLFGNNYELWHAHQRTVRAWSHLQFIKLVREPSESNQIFGLTEKNCNAMKFGDRHQTTRLGSSSRNSEALIL